MTRRRTPHRSPAAANVVPFRPRLVPPPPPAPEPPDEFELLRRLCGLLAALGTVATEIRDEIDSRAPTKPAS